MSTTDYYYYPALSDLITVDDLPEILSFIKGDLQQLFGNIYYKNIQSSRNFGGDGAFYSLSVISKQKIEIGIFDTGLYLVLNPDYDDNSISSFPTTVFWEWQILKYVRIFDATSFSFSGIELFDLSLAVFSVTEEQALIIAAYNFAVPTDPTITVLGQLVIDINTLYGSNIIIDEGSIDPYQDLITQIDAINQDVYSTVFNLYILDADPATEQSHLNSFFSIFIQSDLSSYITDLITPQARATLELTAALEFPRDYLLPMVQTSNGFVPDNSTDSSGNLKQTYIQFGDAILDLDTSTGFSYQSDFAGTLFPQYAQIANTCLIISFTDVKLDLSQTSNIPEVDAAGYAVDFVGAYIKQAAITINGFGTDDPDNESATLSVSNFIIGTGGISGTISIADQGLLHRNFGNFSAELDTFSITFRQNAITNCDISGAITLNKFTTNGLPAKIDIQAQIKDDGSFSITALPQPGAVTITFPNVFQLNVRTLSIGQQQPKGFYIEVSGVLDFIADVPVLGEVLPKGINITKLRIWDNGDIEFAAGIVIPKSFRLQIGPVKMEVSNLSVGSYNRTLNNVSRSYRYFGFDGMINTGNAGVDVSGNGIKYYYTVDDGPGMPFDNFIRIDQIAIDITVPGNASASDADFILKGYLKVGTPNPNVPTSTIGEEYTGSVAFSLPKLGMAGSAGMSMDPSIPSYVVDIGLNLSTPILLGATGLGIYGFRGLIGEHYLPSKAATTPPLPDTASWWDYYKAKNVPDGLEGIEIDKFAEEPGFSLGAGLTIATTYDSGFTFSAKLFLLLGLPDVFLLQGQAGILQSRIGLDNKVDPPFSALIAIDSTSFTGNLGVNYALPSDGSFKGDVFTLQGTLALAFFFNNASGWYLNLGQDQPTSARIQAKVLTLFKGYAYVMISAKGFKAGAGASFDFSKSFGPVGVSIGASLDLGATISFTPIQVGGFIQFGGYASLKLFWFKIGLSVQVSLAVEAPHPFNITGGLQVKVHTPWPLPNINFRLDISWHFNNNNAPLLAPFPILQLPDPTTGYNPAVALNIMSLETFPVNYVNQIMTGEITIPAPGSASWQYNFTDPTAVMQVTIPLDSYIDIELLKPVSPALVSLGGAGSQLPLGYTELQPPVKGVSSQVKHSYAITALNIFVWDAAATGGGAWMPYNVYEAVTAIVDGNTGDDPIDLSTLPPGYWQFAQPNTYNKIRLLSQTMFTYANQTDTATTNLDGLNFQRKDIFCYETVIEQNLVNWIGETLGTVYAAGATVMISGVSFTFNGLDGSVATNTTFGNNSLYMAPMSGSLAVVFPVPVTSYEIDFGPNQNNITINPVVTNFTNTDFGQTIPVDTYLAPTQLSPSQQNTSITYNDIDQPINKVYLTFNTAYPIDFTGNLLIGGYFQLPDQFLPVTNPQFHHEYDINKALLYVSLFNKSFTAEEVLQKKYSDTDGIAGQWILNSTQDTTGVSNGIITGDPDLVPGFWQQDSDQQLQQQEVYAYSANTDGLLVPFNPVLKVESASFAFEVTAIFNPYSPGIITLLSKVNTDPVSGYKKGYALHIYQQKPGDPSKAYTDPAAVPSFNIWLTCYDGLQVSGTQATGLYTLDFTNSTLATMQYKHILVSIDRDAGTLSIYMDRVQLLTGPIPAELALVNIQPAVTYIDQLSYQTESQQASQQDNNITPAGVINEIQLMSDNLNKTTQPVWRPDSTFAITVSTRDVVNGNQSGAITYTQVFGFQTAGPVGLFQQQSAVYQNLVQQDQADTFKLADLTDYIDYDRSTPDAQGRQNLSKPVLYHNPQINLFFTMPYINAMYTDWDTYQGLPAIQSSLQVQLLDPYGNALTPDLVWTETTQTIDSSNYTSLPKDQQLLFLLDQAASQDACNASPLTITKTIKQGSYQFPDLSAGKLYTALFNAVYQPDGADQQVAEVHKFSFLASLFATFQDQAASFILDDTPGAEQYALYPLEVAFTAVAITATLIPLLNDSPDTDSALVAQYAVPYDRMVYGGLQIKSFEPAVNSIINPVINTDPDTNEKTILGIIIRNPEPFNDPKLPAAELADTIQPTLTLPGGTVITPDAFINLYAGDTSAVFISNTAMQLSPGDLQVYFRYKIFNGNDYDTVYEDYTSPPIGISAD